MAAPSYMYIIMLCVCDRLDFCSVFISDVWLKMVFNFLPLMGDGVRVLPETVTDVRVPRIGRRALKLDRRTFAIDLFGNRLVLSSETRTRIVDCSGCEQFRPRVSRKITVSVTHRHTHTRYFWALNDLNFDWRLKKFFFLRFYVYTYYTVLAVTFDSDRVVTVSKYSAGPLSANV